MYSLLFVDDERLVVDTLAETIPWHELEITHVFKAYSVTEAMQLLNTHSIDIVVTDIKMPEFSGLDLLKAMKRTHARVKCILLSGHADFEYAKEAIAAHAVDYLLKPASDEEIISSVKKAIQALDHEWAQVASYQNAVNALRENTPLLRSNLLNDLIKGKKFSEKILSEKLNILELSFTLEDTFAIMMIRLEEDYAQYDMYSLALFEYAIDNIALETFGEHFHLFAGKDNFDFMVFLVKLKASKENNLVNMEQWVEKRAQLFQETALKLQNNIRTFLKGKVSVVVSNWGSFPQDVSGFYQECISAIRRIIGNDKELFIALSGDNQSIEFQSLQGIYEQPTIFQLLDIGKKEALLGKITIIFDELEAGWAESQEHMLEVFFSLAAAFSYITHKNGKRLEDIIGPHFEFIVSRKPFLNIKQFKEWTMQVIDLIFEDINQERQDNKSSIVKQVKGYVSSHLSDDVSLQTIADRVFLHPVYLSKIFKSETGENLSEYIIQLKMEHASYLLKNTSHKIYEICSQIGYQNPPYFIKVFKKYFDVTPQEYRQMKNGK